jgi:hypothetical protein
MIPAHVSGNPYSIGPRRTAYLFLKRSVFPSKSQGLQSNTFAVMQLAWSTYSVMHMIWDALPAKGRNPP